MFSKYHKTVPITVTVSCLCTVQKKTVDNSTNLHSTHGVNKGLSSSEDLLYMGLSKACHSATPNGLGSTFEVTKSSWLLLWVRGTAKYLVRRFSVDEEVGGLKMRGEALHIHVLTNEVTHPCSTEVSTWLPVKKGVVLSVYCIKNYWTLTIGMYLLSLPCFMY